MKRVLTLVLCVALALGAAGALAQEGDAQLAQELDSMLPIADSVLRTMGIEGEIPFDPSNPEFAWDVLYLTGVNWAFIAEDIEYTDDYSRVVVPAARMAEFARALGLDEVPAIPESMAHAVSYDAARDAYLIEASDVGDSYTRIDAFEAVGDDIEITVALYGYGESDYEYIGGIKVRLTPDPEPTALFEYRVVSAG